MIRIGQPAGLMFELEFDASVSPGRGDAAAFGRITVWQGDNLVWGRLDDSGRTIGVEWYLIDLLEFLAANWKYIQYEQGYPFGVRPFRPSGFAIELNHRWRTSGIDVESEDEIACGFESSHNLAMGFQGCVVPDLWIVREGRQFLIESKGRVLRCPSGRELDTLRDLGDALSDHVRNHSDARSIAARDAWQRRDSPTFDELAEIVTQERGVRLRQLAEGVALADYFAASTSRSAADNVFLDLVYRCKGLASDLQIRKLIARGKSASDRRNALLERLTDRLEKEARSLESQGMPAYAQGRKLALALRHDRDLFPDRTAKAEPESLLNMMDVMVERWPFQSDALDAVAIWGADRQPWIVVNRHEKHIQNVGAERATVAHELCHLLVDRNDVLPLSAVVGGPLDRTAEQRANAFAAEFLCPRFCLRLIYDEWLSARETVEKAALVYGVSMELAALQLARSDCELSETDRREIEDMVSPYAALPWRAL